jgi:hypothetical protein
VCVNDDAPPRGLTNAAGIVLSLARPLRRSARRATACGLGHRSSGVTGIAWVVWQDVCRDGLSISHRAGVMVPGKRAVNTDDRPPPRLVIVRIRTNRWTVERGLFVVLLLAPFLGLVGVVVGEVVPDGRIAYNLLRGYRSGVLGVEERPLTPLATTMDRYTECVAVTVGLGDPRGSNFVKSAVLSPAYRGCEQAAARLEALDATGALPEASPYLRYWHGYAVVTRPSLAIVGLAGTRWIALGLLAGAVTLLSLAVKRLVGVVAAGLLVVPALLTTDLMLGGLTIPHAIGLGAAWLGGWIALGAVSRAPSWKAAGLAGALAGAVMAYFDLLTTMPGSLALTAVGATLALYSTGTATRTAWRVTAAAVIGWALGLMWMWSWKWVFAAIAVGPSTVLDNVKSQIEFRLSGDYEGVSDAPLRGLTSNLEYWWNEPLTPLVIVGVAAVILAAAWRHRRPISVRDISCAAIVVVPIVMWYLALSNHNQIHVWVTYRSIPLAFGALSALVFVAATASSPAREHASVNVGSPDRADARRSHRMRRPTSDRATDPHGNGATSTGNE